MSMASTASWKPMPSTSSDPVMEPVMIMGKPSQIMLTENMLRRAFSGTGACSYSSPRR